ncbi:amidohydrolase family protein [Aspergillus niger]|uniref:Uncharacterized protein n=2 Tax=Aspergillus niger TaxID=5061 RepID=A2R2H6_ASPNC|nr:hypothetical protein An14g00770 [Aspergillus niger]GJP93468.1 amidohydrolase family protein [Aspergillus niger]CAK41876.1 hypothetical protein An14g00770 [Aspergillus niger]
MDPGAVQKRLAQAAVKLYKARKELKRYKAAKKIVEEQEAEAAEKAETTEYIRRPTFSILETILEVSEVKTVDIEVHGMKAKFYLSRPDEDIVPLRYLKKADTDKIVHRAVWIFSKAKDGRQVNQDKWPTLETVFFDVFHNLKNSPQWDKALFDDDKGSTATCPPNTDFRLARFNQDNVLHALISELFFNVDVMHPTSKPMLWFHLQYVTTSTLKDPTQPPSTNASSSSNQSESHGRNFRTLTDNQPLDKALCQNFQLHLGQLLTNLHHLHINKYCLPDQEVFLINLHGSRLHVQRAVFPSPKISRIYCKKYKPADPKSELHTFRAGDTTRRYTEQDLEYDIDQLDWLHTLREDNNEAPDEEDKPVIRVLASQEYDLWTRSGWHAALKLLAGLNRYLMGGRAKCGVMQNMFEKFPIAESPPKESSAAKS